uniref:Uncharacterized protein n=1 Tax=Cebus imitator TaxID=2715852 RepID=A0A2K5PSM1_CEBIM
VGRASYRGSPVGHQSSPSPVRDGPRTVLHFLLSKEASGSARSSGVWMNDLRGCMRGQPPGFSPLTSTPTRPLHRAPLLPGRLCWSPCPLEESKAMGRPLLLPLLLLPLFLQAELLGPALPELEGGSGERLPQDLEPAEGGPVWNQTHHHPGCQDHHLETQQHNHHSQPRSHRGQRALKVLAPKPGDYCVGGSGCHCTWNHDFGTDLPLLVEEKK